MKSRAVLLVAILGMILLQGASGDDGITPVAELHEGFEPPPGGFAEGASHSWSIVSGNASVSTDVSFSGNYSLKIEAGDPNAEVAFDLPELPNAGNTSVTFVDLRILAIAQTDQNAGTTVAASGAQSGFLLVGEHGEVFAYDEHQATNKWVDTGFSLATRGEGAIADWVRLTVRVDHAGAKWDLYVNGQMVVADLGLEPSAANRLVLFGDLQAPIYIDDVYASTTNPLFVDLNGDGLPDAWVLAHHTGSNFSGDPRTWLDPVTGLPLSQQYLQTVAALSAYRAYYEQPIVFVHPSDSLL